jgi:hypothetical protein
MIRIAAAMVAALWLMAVSPAFAEEPIAPPRRAAILVGTEEYQSDDYRAETGKPLMLRDLDTPCDGVEEISAKLQMLGWSFAENDPNSEIRTFCNADPTTVEKKIKSMVARLDRPQDFLFIYIAGHGAEVGRRNYMFGTDAEIDLELEARRLQSYNGNVLFLDSAFDLESAVFRPAGAVYRGNVLVVLDTCRDDPVTYNAITLRLGQAVGGPQVDQRAPGVMIYYATAPGRRVRDGIGLSHMARRLSENIVSGKRIDQITSLVTRKVTEETLTSEAPETPIPNGQLNNTDLCFAGCVVTQRGPATHKIQLAEARPTRPAALVRNDVSPALPGTGSLMERQPQFTYLRREAGLDGPSIDVEIFWCSGDDDYAREEQARRLAARSTYLVLKLEEGLSLRSGTVRYRQLTDAENKQPSLRLGDDVVRVDFDSATEQAFAVNFLKEAGLPFAVQRVRLRTPDSISVYLCKGADVPIGTKRLVVQAAREEQRGIAAILSGFVAAKMPDLLVTDVDTREETQKISPVETQIRFFHLLDGPLALKIVGLVEEGSGHRPALRFLPKYSRSARRGDVELWVGSALDPVATVQALSAATTNRTDF